MSEIELQDITVEDGPWIPMEFIDDPDDFTPLTAEALNHMNAGIKRANDVCDFLSQLPIVPYSGYIHGMQSGTEIDIGVYTDKSCDNGMYLAASTGGLVLVRKTNGKSTVIKTFIAS